MPLENSRLFCYSTGCMQRSHLLIRDTSLTSRIVWYRHNWLTSAGYPYFMLGSIHTFFKITQRKNNSLTDACVIFNIPEVIIRFQSPELSRKLAETLRIAKICLKYEESHNYRFSFFTLTTLTALTMTFTWPCQRSNSYHTVTWLQRSV